MKLTEKTENIDIRKTFRSWENKIVHRENESQAENLGGKKKRQKKERGFPSNQNEGTIR